MPWPETPVKENLRFLFVTTIVVKSQTGDLSPIGDTVSTTFAEAIS
jgi:hypothetical protein